MNTVTAIKEGDKVVFQEVFNQYHRKLYYFILKKTKSEYLAEEVVQTAFIKLWKIRGSLNDRFTISTQLYRIASTTLIDALRKKNTTASIVRELKEMDNYTVHNTPFDKIAEKELLVRIKSAVQKMPPVQRKVFELNREEGLSYKEIATKLSISVKTVEIHISKSLKFLKKRLINAIILVVIKIY